MKARGSMLVGKILQAVLKESRYTLREISKETGVSISTLTDWQSGRTPRDLEKLRRVAHFFGLSLLTTSLLDRKLRYENQSGQTKIIQVLPRIIFSGTQSLDL